MKQRDYLFTLEKEGGVQPGVAFRERFPHLSELVEKHDKTYSLPLTENIKERIAEQKDKEVPSAREKTIQDYVIKEVLNTEIETKQHIFKEDYEGKRPT